MKTMTQKRATEAQERASRTPARDLNMRASGWMAQKVRFYAVADTQDRADRIAAAGVAEPDGILRRPERSL